MNNTPDILTTIATIIGTKLGDAIVALIDKMFPPDKDDEAKAPEQLDGMNTDLKPKFET